jgi:hypothetical protein
LEGDFPRFGCEGWKAQKMECIIEYLYSGPDLDEKCLFIKILKGYQKAEFYAELKSI